MTAPWLIDQLFAHPERLKSLAGWLTDNDIAALARPKGSPLTRSDIPLLDEAMDMLGPDPKAVARQSAATHVVPPKSSMPKTLWPRPVWVEASSPVRCCSTR